MVFPLLNFSLTRFFIIFAYTNPHALQSVRGPMGPRLHSGVDVALQPKHVWPWFSELPAAPSSVFCFFEEGAAELVGVAVAVVVAAAFVFPAALPFSTPSFVSSLVFELIGVAVVGVIVGMPFAPLSEE